MVVHGHDPNLLVALSSFAQSSGRRLMTELLNARFTRFVLAIAAVFAASAAVAHPIDPVPRTDSKLPGEVAAFRKEFQAAGLNRDAAALRRYYTDDFTHTHTSGKVDGKDARIVSVIAAEQTVEMAPVAEFNLSCFGESVCIARALSPIRRATDGKWFDVRWTQTYVKTSKGWQIAISQATALPNTVRDAP
jgi:ketosteroid isomerase-like protein